MNNAVCTQRKVSPVRHRATTAVLKLDEARRVYLGAVNRLDLATLARSFADAPASVEVSGKMPKPQR